jgi:hypothetical protein
MGQTSVRSGVAALGFFAAGVAATAALMGGISHAQAGQGKVTPWAVMKTAAAKVPGGRAISATYLFEGGHWMYDVIVVKGQTLSEAEVDATTGKVGDVETVTPEEEGKEFAADLNKAIGKKSAAPAEKDEKDEK